MCHLIVVICLFYRPQVSVVQPSVVLPNVVAPRKTSLGDRRNLDSVSAKHVRFSKYIDRFEAVQSSNGNVVMKQCNLV
jgi:hypothetical protein